MHQLTEPAHWCGAHLDHGILSRLQEQRRWCAQWGGAGVEPGPQPGETHTTELRLQPKEMFSHLGFFEAECYVAQDSLGLAS